MMKLAHFKDIPPLERLFVDQLFGYLAGVPCYVALLDHHQRWVLYRIDMQAGKGGTRLTETKTVKSIKDVLSFYRDKGFSPFYPKPDYMAPIAYPSAIQTDKRRHTRKAVEFSGTYRNHRTGTRGTCLIENISYTGLRFTVDMQECIEVPDRLRLKVNVNDPRGRNLEKSALVRHVEMKSIGVEFVR